MATYVQPVTLVAGQRENVNDLNLILAAIGTTLNSIDSANLANQAVTGDKLGTTLAQQLGVTNAANVGRGKSIIATSEARANASFGLLTTPDQVQNIVLPTDGLIFVAYQAMWSNTLANSAGASIFVGANQAKIAQAGVAAPIVQTAVSDGNNGVVTPLTTGPGGLMANAVATPTSYTGDVTTGQILGNATYEAAIGGSTGATAPRAPIGGPCTLFAAAGTYTISIQFLAGGGGTTTVLNRKLWCWTMGF